jgi:ATP diphosphatase
MTIPPEPALSWLIEIMARLRSPVGGCPWDQAQRFETIAAYTVEEAYEVSDAIGRGPEMGALLDELGDLLLQIVYHARMAEEIGAFGFGDVAEAISRKMIRRHPHIFGDSETDNPGWEALKQLERSEAEDAGVLAGVPVGLPALTRALKLAQRAARVGFDWPDTDSVLSKLDEEITELRAEIPGQDPARLSDELGDMLFVLANLGRKLGLDPEACLQAANAKFSRRFNSVEARLGGRGLSPADAGLNAMEAEWQAVKRAERHDDEPTSEAK